MRGSPRTAIALVVGLVFGVVALLAATGFDVAGALIALVNGSVGSWYAIGSGTLVQATPLILTGLAVALAFRAGVFNIGADGQFIVGAAAATATALAIGGTSRIVVLPLILAGGCVALVDGVATVAIRDRGAWREPRGHG